MKIMNEEKIVEILAPVGAEEEARRENRVRERFLRAFRRVATNIPFAEDLLAAYYCALDPLTPAKTKAILFAALAYFILPFDTVPDFLAFIGFGDDIAVLAAAVSAISGQLKPAHREAARKTLAEAREDLKTG